MSVLAALVFFFMAVISEINADSDALKEAKSYIYSSDLQKPDGNFRKVISVSKVDRSDGLSMAMDVLPTSCPVSSKLSQEKVYSDACPVSNEYEKIECQLKLDENKNGQLKCSALEEAKEYIYAFDSQGGRGNFRKVLSVKDVDRSDGLSLTLEALPTTCPVSSDMSMDKVYSDECPTTTEEYDQIECRLKLDASKAGHIECTYYAS
ncbi:hypothetical protein T4A_13643 [Trichinella pseudospiralis]|uniref:Secreted protein n=1 Tax=Trichinella pseudospiralis TaxID=6337 RepID=A0A0V1EU34_TRIPS|nr:hypothetical protein T4A_13643 [Trichinella pseudospiralis]